MPAPTTASIRRCLAVPGSPSSNEVAWFDCPAVQQQEQVQMPTTTFPVYNNGIVLEDTRMSPDACVDTSDWRDTLFTSSGSDQSAGMYISLDQLQQPVHPHCYSGDVKVVIPPPSDIMVFNGVLV